MRTGDDGEPLVHRVTTDRDSMAEARLGLDQLLAKSAAIRSREARERAAKLLEEESDAVRERRMRTAQALAERFEWKPVASVAIFEDQTCRNCGTTHSIFRGFATLMERKSDQIKRLAAADCLDQGLPFQRRELPASAPVCVSCLDRFVPGPHVASHEFLPVNRSEE